MEQKWPAARIIHLVGGCRALVNQDKIVHFLPITIEGKEWQFEANDYYGVYQDLKSLGVQIVGVDFYSHDLEIDGCVPPDWRTYFSREGKTFWSAEETTRKWRNISNAGFKKKDGILWDTASRISHQLRACDWRLRDISEAYSNQLLAKLKQKDFIVGTEYADGFTRLTYLSLQSFLVDACILRDYLSEFAAEYLYKDMIDFKKTRITTMSNLRKYVLKNISVPDKLTRELQIASDDKGWLTLLGNYRNLIVHSAPLTQANVQPLSLCRQLKIIDGVNIPILHCPIPEKPNEILTARSTGVYFDNFSNQLNSFAKAATGNIPTIDGIEYAITVLEKLVFLAEEIAKRSLVAPEPLIFNGSNSKIIDNL